MRTRTAMLLATVVATTVSACRDDSPTGPAGSPTEARVFTDNFVAADFQAFQGSKLDAVQLDTEIKFRGTTSLRVTVPAPGNPAEGYAGGAFVASAGRNLTGYNALTFYARASVAITLDVAGLGNDNTGSSQFTAERNGIPLTTTWQKVTIPIPDASKLTAERGLFFFAEGAEGAAGYSVWFDDIQFETVSTIANPRPALAAATVTTEVGATQQVSGLSVTYAVDGADVTVLAAPRYFSFASSNPSVATVNAGGVVSLGGIGTTNITASLGTTPAAGALALTAVAAPSAAAPTPTRDAADVISLFSDAYTNRTVDTWSAEWDQADVTDVPVGGNAAKRYANFVFAGIEFTSAPVNVSTMTHFHIDAYVNSNEALRVKLVDFGPNGVFGGGDDTEHEVVFGPGQLTAGAWNSLDIPLSAFAGMTGRTAVAQLILSGSSPITYIDNVYFYRSAAALAPTVAAPTPTFPAGDVISLFSNAYTNVAVNTWSADWDAADVADVQIAGNATKRYTSLTFAGIEFTSSPVNASAMTHFRMDIWTPDATAAPAAFKVKLVDFGANGVFGGGDDVEHELTFTATSTPALATGAWVTLDIPLAQFTNLTTRGNLAQMILVGDGGIDTVFVDNVLFRR
jgi:hypothetical protein